MTGHQEITSLSGPARVRVHTRTWGPQRGAQGPGAPIRIVFVSVPHVLTLSVQQTRPWLQSLALDPLRKYGMREYVRRPKPPALHPELELGPAQLLAPWGSHLLRVLWTLDTRALPAASGEAVIFRGSPSAETTEGQGPPAACGQPIPKTAGQEARSKPTQQRSGEKDTKTERTAPQVPPAQGRELCSDTGPSTSEEVSATLSRGPMLANSASGGSGVCRPPQGAGDTQRQSFSLGGGTQMSHFVETCPWRGRTGDSPALGRVPALGVLTRGERGTRFAHSFPSVPHSKLSTGFLPISCRPEARAQRGRVTCPRSHSGSAEKASIASAVRISSRGSCSRGPDVPPVPTMPSRGLGVAPAPQRGLTPPPRNQCQLNPGTCVPSATV